MNTQKAISHYEHGISHDIFSEPVTTYARLAVEALREKKEREKGCEFCRTEEQYNPGGRVFYKELPHDARFLTTLDDAHLQIAFDEKSGWVLHFEDEYGDRMFDIKINRCPMCGRDLRKEQTNA